MQALAHETRKMAEIVEGNELCDAALIASAQKLEHYEIAAYGTAAALAGQLNLRDDQKALHQTLEEKKKADAVLTQLAKGSIQGFAVTLLIGNLATLFAAVFVSRLIFDFEVDVLRAPRILVTWRRIA